MTAYQSMKEVSSTFATFQAKLIEHLLFICNFQVKEEYVNQVNMINNESNRLMYVELQEHKDTEKVTLSPIELWVSENNDKADEILSKAYDYINFWFESKELSEVSFVLYKQDESNGSDSDIDLKPNEYSISNNINTSIKLITDILPQSHTKLNHNE